MLIMIILYCNNKISRSVKYLQITISTTPSVGGLDNGVGVRSTGTITIVLIVSSEGKGRSLANKIWWRENVSSTTLCT